ncbi:toxin-antitoxin system YwqK family antitoxin [Rhodanobacter hydrolyticus]|uniref:Toxin-antitoxin system YwqK family antitoxin n=1 Tax=Rhodanobacter hydrolyticus TaxID=2250595 RepID=A0ABW8J9M0_9GAMM
MCNEEPIICRRHWPNGQVKEEWSEVNGLKEGWRRFFLESGFLFSEMEFRNGDGNGVIHEWRADGSLRLDANLKDGEFHGSYRTWWANGLLMEEGVFDNGKHTKGFRYYTESGELWKEVQDDFIAPPPFSSTDIS